MVVKTVLSKYSTVHHFSEIHKLNLCLSLQRAVLTTHSVENFGGTTNRSKDRSLIRRHSHALTPELTRRAASPRVCVVVCLLVCGTVAKWPPLRTNERTNEPTTERTGKWRTQRLFSLPAHSQPQWTVTGADTIAVKHLHSGGERRQCAAIVAV